MAANMLSFLALAERDFSEIWMERENQLATEYTQVFEVGSFDGKLYRREAKMAGFDGMLEIAEGDKISYSDPIAPVTRRYDYVTRGRGYRVTRKLWEGDEYGQVRNLEKALKRATDDDIEQFAFGLLNNATATTVATGFDGLALASTAHTRLDGGAVQANKPSSGQALSLASLKDGVTSFRKFKDDRGRPYNSEPKMLVIPVDLKFTAEEILGSPDRPDTTNRAINSLRAVPLTTKAFRYITSTTFWSLMGPDHDVKVLWHKKPETDSKTDFETRNIHRIVFFDIGRGFGEWRDYYQGNS